MKKTLITLILAAMTTATLAMPARKGIIRTIRLADGTEVRAELRGDEFMRYYQAANGTCYSAADDGTFAVTNMEQLRAAARQKREKLDSRRKALQKLAAAQAGNGMMRTPQFNYVGPGLTTGIYGKKKGLILLVEFPDRQFAQGHGQAFYNDVANKEGFSEGKFHGSVRDYFLAQSGGQFDLTFDVSRVLMAPKEHSYYGRNSMGSDTRVGELVAWACSQVKDEYDFSQYDWNGDGYVDQVFVLYAGYGENATDDADDIWPHMFYLSQSDYRKELPVGDVVIDTYACSCELNPENEPDGLGTICHEFSHCLGFTDLYDTDYSGGYGMGAWDLMDYGGYNGDGYTPACYTGYEKWAAGWMEPKELKADTVVANLQPTYQQGDCYLIYNDKNRDEFYFIDNRQQGGWDAALPGNGLIITHVDYDRSVWASNGVNDNAKHQRMSVFSADNQVNVETGNTRDYKYDAYPYVKDGVVVNDSLTDTSLPAADLFNYNYDASFKMQKAVLDIKQNEGQTMSFKFRGLRKTELAEGTEVFRETFDQCKSKGGNDSIFNKGANGMLRTDIDGWTSTTRGYGGNKCARFGSTTVGAEATSPAFRTPGAMTLTFKAAPWTGDKNGRKLTVSCEGKVIFTADMTENRWNEYTVQFDAAEEAGQLTFSCTGRLFLDEVTVVYNHKTSTGISSLHKDDNHNNDNRVFTISGMYVGNDLNAIGKGLYIVNGKKVVK